jgi:hypothetical protein
VVGQLPSNLIEASYIIGRRGPRLLGPYKMPFSEGRSLSFVLQQDSIIKAKLIHGESPVRCVITIQQSVEREREVA